ncbi:indolepyruvate oxidoreductase subunit iorb [hydrocarbon metagenome]|uniref:Indolepyruvate oxidoreductase subunit iorb n=1 Tax=hydrocarbon metagenome TaxID=938273 RepID=A0A0W8FFH7_9ZZZZ
MRYRHFLQPGGKLVTNRRIIVPTSVYTQKIDIPDEETVLAALGDLAITAIDAAALAAEAGSPLSQNIVMLGAASHHIPLSPDSLAAAVQRCVPPKTVEVNQKAFGLGRDAGRRH